MRSYQISAAAAAALLVTLGCGGGNGGPSNSAPTAKFSFACTLLACTFTDASTDADGTVASRAWIFGEPASGSNTSTEQNPAHTYAAAGAFHVTLKVTDNDGAVSGTADSTVTVSDVFVNTNPTAQFDFTCTSLDCTFTDQSTDPDAGDAIASWAWDFGDGTTSTVQNPTHAYTVAALTNETVTLTVTDNNGGTAIATHHAVVAPPAGLSCNGSDCSLDLTSPAVVTVTLTSEDCNADGNTFIITSPAPADTLFTDGCHLTTPAAFVLNNGAAYTTGTQLTAAVVSGSGQLGFSPTIRVTGAFPDWTLEFDDGEAGPGEPDFNDLVLTVHAQ